MKEKNYQLDHNFIQRAARAVRAYEREINRNNIPQPNDGSNHHPRLVRAIEVISGSANSANLYDAKFYELMYDDGTESWDQSEVAECYAFGGDDTLAQGYYIGIREGIHTDDKLVFRTVGSVIQEEEELVPFDVITDVCVEKDGCEGSGSGESEYELCDLPINSLTEPTYVAACFVSGEELTSALFSVDNLQLLDGWNPEGAALPHNYLWMGNPDGVAEAGNLPSHNTIITDGFGALTGVAHGLTAGHVFTSNGVSSAPSWQVNPASVGGYARLGSSYTITSNDTWENTGLSFNVPSTGTYLIVCQVRYSLFNSGNRFGAARLYNASAGSELAGSATWLERCNANVEFASTAVIVWRGSLTAGHTIRLEAKRSAGGTWTTSAINTDANGETSIMYNRVA